MTETLLRNWLNLPSGTWPPNYFTLLDLPTGEANADEIEERVLVRMERLRKYQITNPDAVSEGMNLLAKALDTLSDPAARRTYLSSLGIESQPEPKLLDSSPDLLPLDDPSPSQAEDDASLILEPIFLDELEEEAEPEDDEFSRVILLPEFEPPPPPVTPPVSPAPPPPPKKKSPPAAPSLPSKSELETPLEPAQKTTNGRALYQQRAKVRQCLEAWEDARPFMAEASRSFQKRGDQLRLNEIIEGLKKCLPALYELFPDSQSSLTVALLKRPDALEVIRSLLPTQREALAKSFRSIHYDLSDFAVTLRKKVQKRHVRNGFRRYVLPVVKKLWKYPEIAMIPIALVSLLIAVLRS